VWLSSAWCRDDEIEPVKIRRTELASYNPGIVRYARELRKEKVWHVDEQTLTRNLRRAAVQNPGWWDRSRRMYPRGLILETPPGVLIAKRYPLSPAVGWVAWRDCTTLFTRGPDRRVAIFDAGYHALAAAVAHSEEFFDADDHLGDGLFWKLPPRDW
jgi:hypothetical protein